MTTFPPTMTAHLYPSDYEHVPTVEELASQGLAHLLPAPRKGGTAAYRITPEGEAMLRDTMRRNAERMKRIDMERLVESA